MGSVREDSDAAIAEACQTLVAAGAFEPLALGGADEQLWFDCELASLAENRLGEIADASALDSARRAAWIARATSEPLSPPRRREFERFFWLLDQGTRVGTIAVATFLLGARLVRVASLYVLPAHRGRAHGHAALLRLRDALGRRGLGVRLDTHWTWTRAVRLYLRMGLWVGGWKRELAFRWPIGAPPPVVEVGDAMAHLSIVRDGNTVVLARAARDGDRLVLDGEHIRDEPLAWEAVSTPVVELALRGWPLIRSADAWDRLRWSDAVVPESLALRITRWEAWHRAPGWLVPTPRIPGLRYPTWDEIERSDTP
jgi:GNAT superfamily N-acetyltransferase